MDELEGISFEEQLEALKGFVYNNKDFEQLESIVDQFNIFTALDIINKEVRHSNFLSWLLDPSETHNLGEYFTTTFLKQVVVNANISKPDISIFDIDTWDFEYLEVMREWRKIDILLIDDVNEFVCVIENKVDSKEHSSQLTTYKEIVESTYKGYKFMYVLLSKNGVEPEVEKSYVPLSYNEIATLITRLLERKGSQLNTDTKLFIKHYLDMLKRYVMEESDIQKLCEDLYRKHSIALKTLFKYKPDVYSDVKDVAVEIVEENLSLLPDHSTKSYIRFMHKDLDFVPKKGEGWTNTKRILMFEIRNYGKVIDLHLLIGPDPKEIREAIYNHGKTDRKLFSNIGYQMPEKWSSIYKIVLANKSKLDGKSKEDIKAILKDSIDNFIDHDFLRLKNKLAELKENILFQ